MIGYTVKNINTSVDEEQKHVGSVQSGVIKPVRTRYNYINNTMLNGFHTGDIIVLAGMTGGGKTAHGIGVARGIAELNPDCEVLIFSFEYASRKIMSRMMAKDHKQTMKQIYDIENKFDLTNYDKLRTLPIWFVETPLNVPTISQAISDFCNKKPDKIVYVVIDHSLLVEGLVGDSERETLKSIGLMINKIKKEVNAIFCVISQLNDGVLNVQRMSKPAMQYPLEADIFGGRQLGQIADQMTVLINPRRLALPTRSYGDLQLPFDWNIKGTNFPLIYAHTIKARDGKGLVTPLINQLKYSHLIELSKNDMAKFWKKYDKFKDNIEE